MEASDFYTKEENEIVYQLLNDIKETEKGKITMNYLIKDIYPPFWRTFKSKCAEKGYNIKEVLMILIQMFLDNKIELNDKEDY